MEFYRPGANDDGLYTVWVNVKGLTYTNTNREGYLTLSGLSKSGKLPSDFPNIIDIDIDSDYFTSGGGSSSSGNNDDDDWPKEYKSDIVIESVIARNKEGEVIKEVTKDTSPFTLDVVFTDRGFTWEEEGEFADDTLSAFLIDAGDFIPISSNRGTLRQITAPSGDPPRFRATFENLTYAGASTNYGSFEFRVQYYVYGEDVSGTAKGRLYSTKPEDDDEDETEPPTPYIIIDQYDLGSEQIEAGSNFTLSLAFTNTSKEIPLENIRMVINPVTIGTTEQSFLSIASATNTYYYENMAATASLGQAVDILVKATATVGSQALSIDFTYEYVVDKTRKKGETNTTIYVPITQIDRFTVDPITDYSAWMEMGSEGYATVSFVNRGKSTTYNVSGYLVDAEGNQGQTEHHGNLEAGASATLDFTIIPQQTGEYNGQIVIVYEDENGEEKEVPVTFTAFVDEPWYPSFPDPGEMDPDWDMEPEEPATPWWRYALFIVGGLAIAVPMALYLAKRTLAKGKEDFDEDF